MPGVTAQVDINTAPLDGLLQRLAVYAGDRSQALEAIGAVLEANQRTRFSEGKGPDGIPWKESLRVKLFGGQTLLDKGVHLRDSSTHEVRGDAVAWGLTSAIARIHQYGGTIVPKKPGGRLVFGALEAEEDETGDIEGDGLAFARKVVIPARPMVGFDERDREDTRHVLVDLLAKIASGQ